MPLIKNINGFESMVSGKNLRLRGGVDVCVPDRTMASLLMTTFK
jgi:hypothetical protein